MATPRKRLKILRIGIFRVGQSLQYAAFPRRLRGEAEAAQLF